MGLEKQLKLFLFAWKKKPSKIIIQLLKRVFGNEIDVVKV